MNSAKALDQAVKEWKAQGKTKAEIVVLQAEFMLGWPYVWGASGQDCVPDKRRYYMNRSSISEGDANLIKKRCQILNGSKFVCGGCKYYPNGEKTRIQDCQGFDKELFKAVGITLSGAGATSMYDNNKNWKTKGTIENMPLDQVCCVFKRVWNEAKKKYVMEHTGIHIGNGQIIHCSVEVKRGSTSEKGWTHFAVPAGLEGDIPVPTPTHSTIRKGSTGADVVECQNDLIKLGYDLSPYNADGKFGAKTEKAVKEFQTKSGLKADGIVGPLTWEALDKAIEPSPTPVEEKYQVIIHGLSLSDAKAIQANYPGSEVIADRG